jgi:hypothetical protein
MGPKIIELRVHTEIVKGANRKGSSKTALLKNPPKWPHRALVLDCETTIDERQSLTFGCFHYCRPNERSYVMVLEGLFYSDDLDSESVALLLDYSKSHNLQCLSRTAFMKRIFWRAIRAEALIVGFNLPFDLSRLACTSCWTTRGGGAWSFTMSQYKDPETGRPLEDKFKPRLIVKPKDGKGAFFRLTRCIDPKPYPPLRCLDLKTLLWALHSKSLTLDSGCKIYGLEGKTSNHTPSGLVTIEEIEYNRKDVRETVALLNAAHADFDRHPIDLNPDHAYSPASIAKAYLKKMGLVEPREKFKLPPEFTGIAMQSYYGGRAECRIRHTPVPVVYLDFLSQYPTVNTLMGLWPLLTAKQLRIEDATEEVRQLLMNLTLDETFDQEFWKRLPFFALVRPEGDILPVRTAYNNKTSNIGVNPLTSKDLIWYAGPDLVATTIDTRRHPNIVQAIRLIPEGQQDCLEPVELRSMVKIDPRTQDFFKTVIEERARVKADQSLLESERTALSYFLKILANAGSYGLFVEVNPEKVANNPKTGMPKRAKLKVFAGEQIFETTSEIVELPGKWYFPPLAALITAGGRLLLAMLERAVADAGGSYLLCDTDSMAVAASKDGGLVPCIGGPHRLPDGREAIKALSWEEVRSIVAKFERLNPYDRGVIQSILKIEDVNYGPDGKQQQLYGYAIAAKRYALFTRTSDGGIQVVKASAHGLGFLYRPKPGFDNAQETPVWVIEAWDWILRTVLGLPVLEPTWFSLPAMMRIAITTPEVLKALQVRQKALPYQDQTKPFSFILSPIIDNLTGGHPVGAEPDKFTLITPFASDNSHWYGKTFVNVHDGKSYRLAKPGTRLPHEAEPSTYGDVVCRYRWHPESKSLAPNGKRCASHTAGLLLRTPVATAIPFRSIGKETDRRWEREEDFSLLEPLTVEYRPNETERLIKDPILQRDARYQSIRALAKAAGVSLKTVKAARRGQRIRKSTARRIAATLKFLRSTF